MSLLIKALQKAEQSKSEAAESSSNGSAHEAAKSDLELAPRHEDLMSSLKEESGFDGTEGVGRSKQAAAAAVFRAHHNETPTGKLSQPVILAGSGLILLLLLGGGFYYYLKSLEQPALVVSRPITPLPQPQPAAIDVVEKSVLAVPAVQPAPTDAKAPQAQEVSPVSKPVVEEEPVVKVHEATRVQETTAKQPAEQETSVKVTRNRVPASSINDQVMSGYQAYMAGDDVQAGRYYRQAVQAEPRNVDAVLGLAAVAVRQGKSDEASALYMRALELEPRNPAAQAGLISLIGQSDPKASEMRLKDLLNQQPEAAFLHAALGNLYADMGQWASAQQAYFQAYRFDSANAEYAFNLAASLDQMGKRDLAFTYYQRAYELLPKQGVSVIDKAVLEARLSQLRQVLNK